MDIVIKRFVCILLYGIGCFFSTEAVSADSTVVRDLSHDWFFYHHGSGSYLPLVNKSKFNGTTIHFDLNPEEFPDGWLRIKSSRQVSLFINNQMIDIIHGAHVYRIDSISKLISGDQMHFTIYGKKLNPKSIFTEVIRVSPDGQKLLDSEAIIIKTRESGPFMNFAIAALVLLMAFLAALYNYFPRILSEFFKVSKTFSLREVDENLFKSRPLNQINLLFYFYLSLLIALILMFIVNQAGIYLETGIFYPLTFWDGIWKWIQLGFIIMVWFFIKYLLINNLSSLFRLGGFMVSHYFNYIRMTLFIFTVGLIAIVFSYFGFDILAPGYYKTMFHIILVFLGVRVAILFFKLLSTASYQTLHLFSYLCGTEVIPFVVLLYLGLNQPF